MTRKLALLIALSVLGTTPTVFANSRPTAAVRATHKAKGYPMDGLSLRTTAVSRTGTAQVVATRRGLQWLHTVSASGKVQERGLITHPRSAELEPAAPAAPRSRTVSVPQHGSYNATTVVGERKVTLTGNDLVHWEKQANGLATLESHGWR